MRILTITHLYPTPAEPAFAAFNRQQFAALARRHELRVLRPIAWTDRVRFGSAIPQQYSLEVGIDVHAPTYWFPPRAWTASYGHFFERSIAGTARRLLADYRPDVLLGSWAHPDSWATTRLARRAGLPVVVKVHGSDVLVLARGRRRAKVVEALQQANAVVAVSQGLAQAVGAMGVAADRIHVIPHGLDRERFQPGDRAEARARLGLDPDLPLLIFVGNVLVSKGVVDLVQACARLRRRGLRFRCCIIGKGRQASIVNRAIAEHRLGEYVELMGVRSHDELVDWYRACNLVALPSHSEGIPNVLREAASCGRPFVATNVGGIPEIADPSYARLVPAHDIEALADAIEKTLASPPVVDPGRIGQISLSIDASAELLSQLLADVVARHQPVGNAHRDLLAPC